MAVANEDHVDLGPQIRVQCGGRVASSGRRDLDGCRWCRRTWRSSNGSTSSAPGCCSSVCPLVASGCGHGCGGRGRAGLSAAGMCFLFFFRNQLSFPPRKLPFQTLQSKFPPSLESEVAATSSFVKLPHEELYYRRMVWRVRGC